MASDIAHFEARRAIFVRSARDAARHALFFANLLYPSTREPYAEAVRSYWKPALKRIRGLVRGVHVPDSERNSELGKTWLTLSADLENAESSFPFDAIPGLRKRLTDFLYQSMTGSGQATFKSLLHGLKHQDLAIAGRWYASHGVVFTLRFLAKHMSLLLALGLVLGVSFGLEAVRGLLVNERWKLLVFIVILPLPYFYHWWQLSRLHRRDRNLVHPWSLGSRPFWSAFPHIVGPGRLVPRWSNDLKLLRAIARGQAIKFLVYVSGAALAVALIFLLRGTFSAGSTLTVPIILWIFWVVLLIANQLDFWDFLSVHLIRFTALSAVLIVLGFLFIGFGREAFQGLALVVGLILLYQFFVSRSRWVFVLVIFCFGSGAVLWLGGHTYDKRTWRIDPLNRPVRWVQDDVDCERITVEDARQVYGAVLGNEAATQDLRTKLRKDRRAPETFDRLTRSEWPQSSGSAPVRPVVLMAASGGGSRAAVYAALALHGLHRDYPEIAAQLQAISSVSGGSLANAAYVVRRSNCGLEAECFSDLVKAVSGDFLLPTLTGALIPRRSRGESIESAWRAGPVNLGDNSLSTLAKGWRETAGDRPPAYPIPLFNTSTLDGHDLVISPLHHEFYSNSELRHEAQTRQTNRYLDPSLREADGEQREPTWVFYRDGIYGLEDLLDRQDLPLSAAVLASANFPFGFPVVEVDIHDNRANDLLERRSDGSVALDDREELSRACRERPGRPLFFSPEDPNPETVKLTDGGALSNSGMWSLYQLLALNHEVLAHRGVLLVMVEASKMPEYGGIASTFKSLLGALKDQAGIGRNLHERMIDHLSALYGDRLAVAQLDLVAREDLNVMTTWALDQASLDRLKESFESQWRPDSLLLEEKWCYLGCQEGCSERCGIEKGQLISRDRVPLD